MLPTLSSAFATLLNLAKKTQPNIDTSPLEGRSFCVAIDELPQDISIRIADDKVVALEENELPDVTISGSLKAIIYMITHENDGLENDDLYIAGKIGTARQFQHFLASLSIDWQTFFSQFLPDDMATKTAEVWEQGLHAAKGGAEQLGESLKDYIVNEKKIVVTKPELDDLKRGIGKLHQRLDDLNDFIHTLSNRQ